MVGLGTWEFFLDTMFYRGKVFLRVGEKEGGYDIGIDIPGMQMPPFSVNGMAAEGNTVTGMARTDLLPGKDIPFSITFDGDKADGFLKVPFMGKLTLKNGTKIA